MILGPGVLLRDSVEMPQGGAGGPLPSECVGRAIRVERRKAQRMSEVSRDLGSPSSLSSPECQCVWNHPILSRLAPPEWRGGEAQRWLWGLGLSDAEIPRTLSGCPMSEQFRVEGCLSSQGAPDQVVGHRTQAGQEAETKRDDAPRGAAGLVPGQGAGAGGGLGGREARLQADSHPRATVAAPPAPEIEGGGKGPGGEDRVNMRPGLGPGGARRVSARRPGRPHTPPEPLPRWPPAPPPLPAAAAPSMGVAGRGCPGAARALLPLLLPLLLPRAAVLPGPGRVPAPPEGECPAAGAHLAAGAGAGRGSRFPQWLARSGGPGTGLRSFAWPPLPRGPHPLARPRRWRPGAGLGPGADDSSDRVPASRAPGECLPVRRPCRAGSREQGMGSQGPAPPPRPDGATGPRPGHLIPSRQLRSCSLPGRGALLGLLFAEQPLLQDPGIPESWKQQPAWLWGR